LDVPLEMAQAHPERGGGVTPAQRETRSVGHSAR
jgi:hypothetical protein